MIDNVFEIGTAALAECTCMLHDSGILLTDFACACSRVNPEWIFLVLGRAGLPAFTQTFSRTIHDDNTTVAEHAGEAGGHFLVARGAGLGCPASGFLVTVVFDPIFRWFYDVVVPRDPSLPACLQRALCACADDFVVAVPSLRTLMLAIALLSALMTGLQVSISTIKHVTGSMWL